MASGLALAGAGLSGAALGVIAAFRALHADPLEWRFYSWSAALFGGFGGLLAWRSGIDALVAFLLCAVAAALVQTKTMARIGRRAGR